MKKLLYISNISNGVGSFGIAAVEAAKRCGLDFYYAANFSEGSKERMEADEKRLGIHVCQIDFSRSPYGKQNKQAYKQLQELIDREGIDYIHCNTPTGGLYGRLAGKKCKVERVLYQAHGFHFFKGASKKNWMIYYPVEKWLAHKTDGLITINQEDFDLASQKLKLRGNGKVYYVPGVGMELSSYENVPDERTALRGQLLLPEDAVLGLSMGDLIPRKNYATAIKGLALCKEKLPKVHLAICGKGAEEERLKSLAKELHVEDRVHFLGYCTNVKEWLAASDFFYLPSLQEGLPRSTMEAMAMGLPMLLGKIRGNVDLMEECRGGEWFSPQSEVEFSQSLQKLLARDQQEMVDYNKKRIQDFSMEKVVAALTDIYQKEYVTK